MSEFGGSEILRSVGECFLRFESTDASNDVLIAIDDLPVR